MERRNLTSNLQSTGLLTNELAPSAAALSTSPVICEPEKIITKARSKNRGGTHDTRLYHICTLLAYFGIASLLL